MVHTYNDCTGTACVPIWASHFPLPCQDSWSNPKGIWIRRLGGMVLLLRGPVGRSLVCIEHSIMVLRQGKVQGYRDIFRLCWKYRNGKVLFYECPWSTHKVPVIASVRCVWVGCRGSRQLAALQYYSPTLRKARAEGLSSTGFGSPHGRGIAPVAYCTRTITNIEICY